MPSISFNKIKIIDGIPCVTLMGGYTLMVAQLTCCSHRKYIQLVKYIHLLGYQLFYTYHIERVLCIFS